MGTILPFTGETVQPLTALGAHWETTVLNLHAADETKITDYMVHGVHAGMHATGSGLDHF